MSAISAGRSPRVIASNPRRTSCSLSCAIAAQYRARGLGDRVGRRGTAVVAVVLLGGCQARGAGLELADDAALDGLGLRDVVRLAQSALAVRVDELLDVLAL